MSRPARFKEGKRLYKKIQEHVMKGVTYKSNIAAALGMSYANWQRMSNLPGSKIEEVYEEAIAKRDAIVQRAYFDIVNDTNISPRIKADFIKTEKIMIDKKHFDEKYLTGSGAVNPALYIAEQDLLAALQKQPPLRLSHVAEQKVVEEIVEAEYTEQQKEAANG